MADGIVSYLDADAETQAGVKEMLQAQQDAAVEEQQAEAQAIVDRATGETPNG